MTLGHESLENYYRTTFSLIDRFKWPLSDVETMIPFELDVYLALLNQRLTEEAKQDN